MLSTAFRRRRLVLEKLETRRLMVWEAAGPFGATNGQVEGIANRPVSGAMHALLAHPTNADVLYAGATNGGVWKTTNATAAAPTWVPTTDTQTSQSIGAMAFDLADPTVQTLYAGNGLYSSFGRIGSARDGLLKTIDGAATWTRVTGGGVLTGKGISGIVANGNNIVLSVNIADSFTYSNIGIFRSTDGGNSFSHRNSSVGSGLPLGISYDLVADKTNPDILYTSIAIPSVAGTQGIYKSVDAGATWSRVSSAAMDSLITSNTSNLEMATGLSGIVYAAIINAGNMQGLFRSTNSGANWTAMDLPQTNENGTNVGLNPGGTKGPVSGTPEQIAGGQGTIHFSIVADIVDPNIVYVGGDRQPRTFGDTGSFPNSIGANDFSGRLFRGDASQPAGSQFVHLTHSSTLGAAGGGTASNSAPHADSRDMVFDANGNIVEADDGGVYRRTNPRSNTGNWISVVGNLQNTEVHDVAYDSLSNVLISGNQDTGTTQQSTAGATTWTSIHTGDGGDVAIDEILLAGSNQTVRYSSFQNLAGFRRVVYNSAGSPISTNFPALTLTGGGSAFSAAFRTPVQTNAVVGGRLLIQGGNSLYESLDQGATIVEVGPGRGTPSIEQDALVYGGKLNGVNNPDVIWAGAGSTVVHRTLAGANVVATSSQPTGGATVRDIAVDADRYTSATLVTSNAVFRTTNSGANWSNITGNLLSQTADIRSINFVPGVIGAIVVGTRRGVFATSLAELGVWVKLSTALPNVLVPEMEYDATDNILVAGTLGRGVWTLPNATAEIDAVLPPFDFGDAPSSYLVSAAQNGPRHARIGPTLGALRDAEVNGAPSANALGDNLVGLADEDGVTFTSQAIVGQSLSLTVSAPIGGVLNAWIDFNRNGLFEASDRIFTDQTLATGINALSVPIPSNAIAGSSFARFRISTAAGEVTAPTGQALNGEVEDHAINLISNALEARPFYRNSHYQNNGGGVAGATDPTRVAARSGGTAQLLGPANLTNNLQGINGVVLDVPGLVSSSLTNADFTFRMSPTGPFVEAQNPPSAWAPAPDPSTPIVTPGNATTPPRVRLEWPDNAIENRWLQIRVLPTPNTGLQTAQTFYLGHLRGEVDYDATVGSYFVQNADIVAALPVGALGTVSSVRDVDRDGFIVNQDFIYIRLAINAPTGLRNITIPAAGSGAEGGLAPGEDFAAPDILAAPAMVSSVAQSTTPLTVTQIAAPPVAGGESMSDATASEFQIVSLPESLMAEAFNSTIESDDAMAAPPITASDLKNVDKRIGLVDDYFAQFDPSSAYA